jgi:hypothetical protein
MELLTVFVINGLVVALAVVIHYETLYQLARHLPRVRVPPRYKVLWGVFLILVAHVAEIWLFAHTSKSAPVPGAQKKACPKSRLRVPPEGRPRVSSVGQSKWAPVSQMGAHLAVALVVFQAATRRHPVARLAGPVLDLREHGHQRAIELVGRSVGAGRA